MRIETVPTFRVVLSERNLKALLAKLSIPDSACTIYKTIGSLTVYVSAESDEQHYVDRLPGEMHPLTETLLKG